MDNQRIIGPISASVIRKNRSATVGAPCANGPAAGLVRQLVILPE
jgi:hypothetical protein